MKIFVLTVAITSVLVAMPAAVFAQDGMAAMAGMSHTARSAEAQGQGVVKAIDVAQDTITLQHDAISTLHWPAMTMPFKVANPHLLQTVKPGDKVQFTVQLTDHGSVVTELQPAP